jgi:delta-lactam-biosynthetic de-N-acetylase
MGEQKNTGDKRLVYGALILFFSLLMLGVVIAACIRKQALDGSGQDVAVAELESGASDSAANPEGEDAAGAAGNADETDGTDAVGNVDETDSADAPGNTDETGSTDVPNNTGDSGKILGQVLANDMITNIDELDTTVVDWGLGKAKDDAGRPIDAVNAQEKYAAYHALFLGEGENTIYLTFDEGYENGYTESILNTLKEKDVKAVFFVTESYAKSQPELVQRMIDEGHVIGNHSASHPSKGLTSLSREEQQNEVMENHKYVLEQFGYHMYLFRYPAGRFSEQSLAIVNNCNYKSVFWSFAYLDYDVNNQPDPAESLAKMKDRLHPGAIYLLHAESATNAAVLGELIDDIAAQGYSFGTL